MDKFKILIEEAAERDLREIFYYISDTLKEPATAKQLYQTLKVQILSLAHLPLRHPLVADEIFATQGVRKFPIKHYLAFYVVNETRHTVHVIRVLHQRREWQNLL